MESTGLQAFCRGLHHWPSPQWQEEEIRHQVQEQQLVAKVQWELPVVSIHSIWFSLLCQLIQTRNVYFLSVFLKRTKNKWGLPAVSLSFQLTGHRGRAGELRAAGMRERLLLRQGGPHRGHGCAAGEGHSQQGHCHLLATAGQTRPHGRDGPDGAAHPLSAQQRRRGQRVRQAQVRPAIGWRGPQLREEEERERTRVHRDIPDRHSVTHT